MAKLTNAQSRGQSNMSVEISRFVKLIAILSLTMATIVFGVGVAVNSGKHVMNLVIYGFITIIVANVPQGLPGELLL